MSHQQIYAIQQNILKAGIQLSPDKIDSLFKKLYPLTQVDEVQNVKNPATNSGASNLKRPKGRGI